VGLIAGIGSWLLEHLAEPIWGWLVELVEHHLVKMVLVWLFTQHYVLMGMDFPIWIWMVMLALAVILVVAWWNWEPDEAPQDRKFHVWASVFWVLAIVALLSFVVGW
jgi:hypothetical protein